MKRLVAMTAIMISVLGYAQDTEQVSTQMNDEVKEIASVAGKWHEAWMSNDKNTFLELMRPEKPELPERLFGFGKQIFALLEDKSHKTLTVFRTEQEPSLAAVYSYPISIPGRQICFGMMMTKEDGKWYVQSASGLEIDDLGSHYRKWADKFEKHEIWYDEKAPEWLKPGQKESEVAKTIAEIKVTDRKLYQESYGHLLADINRELLEGGRLQRSQLLKAIHKTGLSMIFDDSSIKPLRSCLKSEDVGMTNLARKMYLELRQEVRDQRERDASKIPHSAEEFKALSEEYSRKVSKLDKALAGYRSKQIYRDFLEVLEKEVLPLYDKGRTAGRQMHKMYQRDPNAFKKSAFDEKESSPAIIDICAAVLKGTYEQFGKAVKEGSMRLPDDEQNKIFYWSSLAEFQSRQDLIEKPYEKDCPFERGTIEYYQFMNEVRMGCKLALSPLMTMIKQLPDELEDAREEVEIMHKWLETGEGSRGETEMPELYNELYLNEIDNLAMKEGTDEKQAK